MAHPGIAQVFDAGTAPDGRPYFVMERVEGEPITAYCDRRRLSTRERIALVQQVCDAVRHAHQKGILHRDLKPSNLLVTTPAGEPRVKVIDRLSSDRSPSAEPAGQNPAEDRESLDAMTPAGSRMASAGRGEDSDLDFLARGKHSPGSGMSPQAPRLAMPLTD
jgi:serine/threonine protein kinase